MSSKSTKGEITVLPPEKQLAAKVSSDFENARRYWRGAELHGHMMAACMVFLGMELIALHKKHGIKRGGDRRSDQTRNAASLISWPELVEREMGFSHDTARRFMLMAEAAKSRVKELRGEELLNTPLLSLSPDKQEKLKAAVRKITDGQTAQQLMLDWGITKKSKAGNGGGSGRTEGSEDTRTLAQKSQDALWKIEEAMGTAADSGNFEAFVLALPAHPDFDKELKCSLSGLRTQLERWLEVVREAEKHHKQQGGKRA